MKVRQVRGPLNFACSVLLESLVVVTVLLLGKVKADEKMGRLAALASAPPVDVNLAQQIFETMLKVPGNQAGHRTVHAKGIICRGDFTPSLEAASLSKASHFSVPSVPITVRFSDGSPEPLVPDNAPNAGPRGMAIRFELPGGSKTDIVSMSHNGFVVGSGEDFLSLQQAIVATDNTKEHPWPIEDFLTTHPLALKFVQENSILPTSFATEAFFSNDSFTFVDKNGVRQIGRYKIIPVAGIHKLTAKEAEAKSSNFLFDDLKSGIATNSIKFHLFVVLPNKGDPTKDPSLVWPDDRKSINMGEVNISSVASDSEAAERSLAFSPANLTDGIEFSDDTLPALRAFVYALAVAHRNQG